MATSQKQKLDNPPLKQRFPTFGWQGPTYHDENLWQPIGKYIMQKNKLIFSPNNKKC